MTELQFAPSLRSSSESSSHNLDISNDDNFSNTDNRRHDYQDHQPKAKEEEEGSPKPPLHPDVFLKIRLLIHTTQVGAVIGRGGERIKHLRKDYNAAIEVVSDSENHIPERIVTMSGTIKNILAIMSELIPCLSENQPPSLRSHGSDGSFSVRLLVHYVVAGSVIGTGGSNIRELRQKSGATITVFHDCCPSSSERVILATGTLDAILMTLASVLDTVAETDVRGQTYLYNPFQSYDAHYVDAYGGFPMPDRYGCERGRYFDDSINRHKPYNSLPSPPSRGQKRRRSNEPVLPPLLSGSHNIPPLVDINERLDGRAGGPKTERPQKSARQYSSYNRTSDRLPPSLMANTPYSTPPSLFQQPMAAPSYGMSGDFSDPPPLLAPLPPLLSQPPVQTTEKYTIPPEAAGAVIGPRGSRAHFVRQSTGCRVTISDDITESGNRVITLTGTQAQLDAAKHHMRNFLADFYRTQPHEVPFANHGVHALSDDNHNE